MWPVHTGMWLSIPTITPYLGCSGVGSTLLGEPAPKARLPTEKKDRIVRLLEEWSIKHFCKRQELESFIGHLHHACKVAPQGRTFLWWMIDLLCAFRLDDHPIRLDQEFCRDLTWWREVFQTWNGLLLHAHVDAHPGLPSLL